MKGNERVKNRILFGGALLLFVFSLGVLLYTTWGNDENKPYMAVHLDNGDVYFGKLRYFPRLELVDIFAVQTVVDPEFPNVPTAEIVPLKDALWAPEKLILNKDKIVFIGRVGDNSRVMQAILESKE